MPPRHFVFLQGMPTPFFRAIGNHLKARGCRITGMNLCVGDWIFWHGTDTVHFRGSLAAWPQFFEHFVTDNSVTDLVLLGEQRRYHRPAVEIAHKRGVRVTVTDFGYLRPDWITLEPDGMSGASRFPRDPVRLRQLAAGMPPVDSVGRYADPFWKMALGDLLFSLSNVFVFYLYPQYRRSDHRSHPLIYFPAMGLRLLTEKSRGVRARQRWTAFAAGGARYFVFPLQLAHDFQIKAYSPFANLAMAVGFVLESFAAHADPATCLLIKVHPWDPGLENWEALVLNHCRRLGIGDRVVCLDGGNLDTMIAGSAGMVTVNSTSGVRALQLGSPVKVLGKAIYDIAGLTFPGDLDRYWKHAAPPDAELLDAFLRTLAASIQIRGVFFSEPGRSVAVRAAAERLFAGTVGAPAVPARPVLTRLVVP
jgi:capsular polysaccharide export protein